MTKEKPKRNMTAKQLANLKPFSERSEEEQREMRSKGGKKSGEVRRAKIKRENAMEWLWDTYGIELTEEVIKKGTIQDKKDILKAILPKDKQFENNINVVPQIIVEDEKHKQMLEDL